MTEYLTCAAIIVATLAFVLYRLARSNMIVPAYYEQIHRLNSILGEYRLRKLGCI